MMGPTPDSRAIILLCSYFGYVPHKDGKPLSLRDWIWLEKRIRASALREPGALLEATPAEIKSTLQISDDVVERLRLLLDGNGMLDGNLPSLAFTRYFG